MFRPVFLLPLPAPGSMLDRPATPVLILLIVLALLLVGSLAVYLVSAIRSRGKPKPERLGHGNLGGMAGYSGRGPGQGGPPGSSPGAFALYGRSSPYGSYGSAPEKEEPDPRRR